MRSTLDSDFFAAAKPRVIGHRGYAGAYPENTMASFRAAAEARAPYIELDIHATRDGEVVVSHDSNLHRACGREAIISDLTWAELAAFDAGHSFSIDGRTFPFRGQGLRVPRLADVLEEFRDRRFVVEIKQTSPSVVGSMLDILTGTRMRRRVLIASEHDQPIDELRALAPEIPTNFPSGEVGAFLQVLRAQSPDYNPLGDALQIPPEYEGWRFVTKESVEFAHQLRIEVHVWTVNDPAQMRELLELGVDGIITDFPPRLLDLI